ADESEQPELAPDSSASPEAKRSAKAAAAALARMPKARSAKDKQAIQAYYRTYVDPSHQDIFDAAAQAQRERKTLYDTLPKCLISISTNKRTVRILPRGNWMDESGEVVQAALPHYLPQPDHQGRSLTRLDL